MLRLTLVQGQLNFSELTFYFIYLFRDSTDQETQTFKLCLNLFNNIYNLDLIQIKSNLDLFSHQYHQKEDIEKLRNNLKKIVLQEVLKADNDDRDFYQRCLDETIQELSLGPDREAGYPCTLVGCKFKGNRHRDYLCHIKHDHCSLKNITCNFNKSCKRTFSNIDGLISHLKQSHSQQRNPPQPLFSAATSPLVDMAVKCDRITCGGSKYKNTGELMRHYNTYHANEERQCIFTSCKTVFHAACPTSAMNHFRLKHKQTGNLQLKSQYLDFQAMETLEVVGLPTEDVNLDAGQEVYDEADTAEEAYEEADFEDLDQHVTVETDEDEASEEYYSQYYADFLNRLGHVKFIPQTTISDISDEFLMNTKKTLQRQETALRKSLEEVTISPEKINKIVGDVFEGDPFLKAQEKLDTAYKRTKYIQESPTFVKPQEIVLNQVAVLLGAKKEVIHYVSIVESFKILVQDPSFNKMLKSKKVFNLDDKIRDMKDGSVFKTNQYYESNPEAYTALLYSDAVEVRNPLGAAKGTYKIVQVFYTLSEIDKSQRSQIDRLILVMVFKEKLLKTHKLKTIFKPLVDDLKKLEIGVEVRNPFTRRVKCGVLAYAADNLEASLVGGFSQNFSSRDICRICHVQYSQLEDEIHDVKGTLHGFWSVEEYDRICANEEMDIEDTDPTPAAEITEDTVFRDFQSVDVESDSSTFDSDDEDSDDEDSDDGAVVDTRGLKSVCPLNVLESFHCINGFPLDVMHDLFEGE